MEAAVVGFFAKIAALAVEAATAGAERRREIAAEADRAWDACRAEVFRLEEALDERNRVNLERARELDRAASALASTVGAPERASAAAPAFDTSDVGEEGGE